MATGVLVLGVNRATRLLGHLILADKRYLATIRLGLATTTDDFEGEPLSGKPASEVSLDRVVEEIGKLTGQIEQVPSSVSAIKIDGERAYAKVRSGQQVKLKPRPVTVSRFDLLGHRGDGEYLDLEVDVECSSGTYIRALARDLGEALGVGGHLTALRRTRVGPFLIEHSVKLPDPKTGGVAPPLMPMAEAAKMAMDVVEIDENQAKDVSHGRSLSLVVSSNPTGLIGPTGDLLALYRPGEQGTSVPVAVLVG